MDVKVFTDNRPLLESIASSKQVENKMMREVIADMKEKLMEKKVNAYEWIETKKMVADMLTKEKLETKDMDDIVRRNEYDGLEKQKLKVIADDLEIRMLLLDVS